MGEQILVLMCDSGGGHRSVADAIVGALEHLFPSRYQFQLADIMADGFYFPMNRAGRMYGPLVKRFPGLWGVLWHLSNGRRRSPLTLRMVLPFAAARLKKILVSHRPALIVSTHPWANHIPAWLLQELGWKVPLVTMVTDLVSIHHWWLCPAADLCLVATERVRRKAVEAGLRRNKVRVVGIPVDLAFLDPPKEQRELRKELGLAEDRFSILLAGGGEGMGNVFSVARAVAQASLDVQVVIVAGRNEKLTRKLEAVSWEVPTRVFGFATDMPALMHAADLVITKAGPSTISEALACGLPMLLSGALRGQEEGNVEWVLERGAGLPTPTPEKVVTALREFVQPRNEALAQMAERAHQAARPHAALKAARLIDQLLGTTAGGSRSKRP